MDKNELHISLEVHFEIIKIVHFSSKTHHSELHNVIFQWSLTPNPQLCFQGLGATQEMQFFFENLKILKLRGNLTLFLKIRHYFLPIKTKKIDSKEKNSFLLTIRF